MSALPGGRERESMSGTSDQEENGIPDLTVSVSVQPETLAGASLQYSAQIPAANTVKEGD